MDLEKQIQRFLKEALDKSTSKWKKEVVDEMKHLQDTVDELTATVHNQSKLIQQLTKALQWTNERIHTMSLIHEELTENNIKVLQNVEGMLIEIRNTVKESGSPSISKLLTKMSKVEPIEPKQSLQLQENTCCVCNKIASRCCSLCCTSYYCSIKCQISHWNEHRKRCMEHLCFDNEAPNENPEKLESNVNQEQKNAEENEFTSEDDENILEEEHEKVPKKQPKTETLDVDTLILSLKRGYTVPIPVSEQEAEESILVKENNWDLEWESDKMKEEYNYFRKENEPTKQQVNEIEKVILNALATHGRFNQFTMDTKINCMREIFRILGYEIKSTEDALNEIAEEKKLLMDKKARELEYEDENDLKAGTILDYCKKIFIEKESKQPPLPPLLILIEDGFTITYTSLDQIVMMLGVAEFANRLAGYHIPRYHGIITTLRYFWFVRLEFQRNGACNVHVNQYDFSWPKIHKGTLDKEGYTLITILKGLIQQTKAQMELPQTQIPIRPMHTWTQLHVLYWLKHEIPGIRDEVLRDFKNNHVDGKVLKLMSKDDLLLEQLFPSKPTLLEITGFEKAKQNYKKRRKM